VSIAGRYRYRRHVELFFQRIKKHLRIKAFSGASESPARGACEPISTPGRCFTFSIARWGKACHRRTPAATLAG
jgi:hypothetical protein